MIYRTILLFLSISILSCDSNRSLDSLEQKHDVEVTLEREVLVENRSAILAAIDRAHLDGEIIVVKLCVMPSGKISYAELLDKETTLSFDKSRAKQMLKAIFSMRFKDFSQEEECQEECGVYVIE